MPSLDPFSIAGPVLRALSPETAHDLTLRALRSGLVPAPSGADRDDPSLNTRVLGLDLPNPVGLAAGFDKNAVAIDGLLRLGFGFVEIGSVTPKPQPGNPKPRIFRLPEQGAVINRLGFNNAGLEVAAENLAARRAKGVVGANLGKNKDQTDAVEDYVLGAAALSLLADYLVVNVSSPNTPGLRDLQHAPLKELLDAVRAARRRDVPVLVKIAPDLDPAALERVIDAATSAAVDGITVSNTTLARPDTLPKALAAQAGGLSGKPLFQPSTEILRQAYRLTGGRLPLVGVGGIASGADAYAKIRAGASLVQLYTALVYQGPALVVRIRQELAALLARDGIKQVADAVGLDAGR